MKQPLTPLCPQDLQSDIEKALLVALIAHHGTTDLDGNPVILHPMTVALSGKTDKEKIVGLLHDVVEDTEYTIDDLKEIGFNEEILEALQLLTHTKDMTYEQYLERIKTSGNSLALTVKLNDLQHNLARGRAGNHQKQVAKHEKAWEYLKKYE